MTDVTNRVDSHTGARFRLDRRTFATAALAGVGALTFSQAAGLIGLHGLYANKIYPHVTVGDVPVGGNSPDDAAALIQARADELNTSLVTFNYQGQSWAPSLTDLGITIDVPASVSAAFAMGREKQSATRMDFISSAVMGEQTLPFATRIDDDAFQAYFEQIDTDINDRAVNAGIIIKDNKVTFTPEADGIVSDRNVARAQVVDAIASITPINATLPTRVDKPEVYKDDLAKGKAQVEAILAKPVKATLNAKWWNIDPQDVSAFIRVRVVPHDNGDPGITVTFDERQLSTYLRDTYAEQINTTPVNADVYWDYNENALLAKNDSVDGLTLLSDDFATAVADSFVNGHTDVEVPVLVTKPPVDSANLGALKITSQIGRGVSNYSTGGSWERDHNVEVGAELMSGQLIAPGDNFSFNNAVGPIVPEAGFVIAGVILGESIGSDYGGGICQVSTTAFRAAILGGFPLEEWYPHTFRLDGYELDGWGPGFDASILQQDPYDPSTWADFKFKNVTDSYIYVQSYASWPYVVVEIYGNDPHFDVEISDTWQDGPFPPTSNTENVNYDLPPGTIKQVAWPQDGYTVGFHRTVTAPDGTIISDRDYISAYQSHGAQYDVSPDMAGQSPKM